MNITVNNYSNNDNSSVFECLLYASVTESKLPRLPLPHDRPKLRQGRQLYLKSWQTEKMADCLKITILLGSGFQVLLQNQRSGEELKSKGTIKRDRQ